MDKKVSPRSVSTTPTFVFNPTPVPPKQNTVHKTQTPQASTHKRESTTPTAVSKDNFKTMLHRCAFRLRRRALKVGRAPFARVRPILCEYNFSRITNDYWQISHLPFHLLTLEDFAAEA